MPTTLEDLRLAALARAGLSRDDHAERFDRVARIAAAVIGVPTSLVTLVDEDTQQVLGQNRDGDFVQTRRDAFCSVVVAQNGLLVIEDTAADERFATNPLVTVPGGIRFYAGAPLRSTDGEVLGALCVVDERPRSFPPDHAQLLADLATLAADEIRLARTSRHLADTAARLQHIVRVTSHDLRNTLWAVNGYAEMMGETAPEGSDQADIASTLTQVASHALHLLTELLDSAVLDGAPPPPTAPVDAAPLVRDVAAAAASMAAAKQQALDVRVPDTPVVVRAAATRLRQALDNLVSNALKFTPVGGTVRLRLTPEGAIHIEDSGPGIPADRLADVFEPFAGLPNRPTADEPSTGLGLSIAAQSVRVQGGTIAVETSAFGGACFVVTLPLADAVPEAQAA